MQSPLILSYFNQPSRSRYCAALLSAVLIALYVIVALCLGTGVFHPVAANRNALQGQHDHAHAHHGHHHGPANDDGDQTPSAALLDICDFAIQALTTPAAQFAYQPLHIFAQIETLSIDQDRVLPVLIRLGYSCRAPPLDPSCLV